MMTAAQHTGTDNKTVPQNAFRGTENVKGVAERGGLTRGVVGAFFEAFISFVSAITSCNNKLRQGIGTWWAAVVR